ncbi:hypothetical protein BGZ94_010014 [Podila epigama]|nr:hypothetical protein BGZ94_010014 [Podila epigama]
MGVLGLYSYFESKSLGQRKCWTGSHGTFNDPEHKTLSSTGTTTTTPLAAKKQRFFIMDGNAYIHHLYSRGPFEWIWGGQYSAFVKHLTAQIRALQSAGFTLRFLFDGPLPLQKLQTRLTRDTEKIHRMTRVMSNIKSFYQGYAGLPGASFSLFDPPQNYDHASGQPDHNSGDTLITGGRSSSQFLIPPLVMEVTLQTLRSLGIDLLVCDGEADGLVAQLAMEMSMDPNVEEAYAVSKDSDYFIYNTGPALKGGYIPLDSLYVQTDLESLQTSISATVYSQSAVAQSLGIRPEFLPLFASLTGNDYLRPDVFEDQIARALAASTGQPSPMATKSSSARIRATALFLKGHGAGPQDNSDNKEGEPDTVAKVLQRILDERRSIYAEESEEQLQDLRSLLEESMSQYALVLDNALAQGSDTTESSFSSSQLTPTIYANGSSHLTVVGDAIAKQPSVSSIQGMKQMKDAFHAGKFSYKLMDVVCNKMFWCTPFLEDTDRESSWLASRELRRWVYGILQRNLDLEVAKMNPLVGTVVLTSEGERGNDNNNGEGGDDKEEVEMEEASRDVTEYTRRGDHLSAEIVTGASNEELDAMLAKARRELSTDGDHMTHTGTLLQSEAEVIESKEDSVGSNKGDKIARRVSMMDVDVHEDLGIPVSRDEVNQMRETVKDPLLNQDTLHGHESTTSSEDFSDRTRMFLEILGSNTALVLGLDSPFMVLAATLRYLIHALANSKTRSASISVANFENVLSTVSLLANALHLEETMPPLAWLFDGLLFQETLALARGGTLIEQRFQFPESVVLYEEILAAVEEGFIETGEIDVVVLFRRTGLGSSNNRSRALGIFGSDMDIVHPITDDSHNSAAAGGNSLKATKPGIHKKSSGAKKRTKGGHGGAGSANRKGGNGGGNLFNVLSVGCEF